VDEPEIQPDEGEEEPAKPSRLRRAAGAAAGLAFTHHDKILAALELLREKKAVTRAEEEEIAGAYATADAATRATLERLVERLEEANFGKVVVSIQDRARQEVLKFLTPKAPSAEAPVGAGVTPAMTPPMVPPTNELRETGRTLLREAETSTRALLREAQVSGRGVVDELVAKGRAALGQGETQEMERVAFRWLLETVTKLEQAVVKTLLGTGLVLMTIALLVAAHQTAWLAGFVHYLEIFLLIVGGLYMVSWSRKVSRWAKENREDLERFVASTPSQRLKTLLDESERAKNAAKTSSPTPPTDK
jgi:hypothetical protein